MLASKGEMLPVFGPFPFFAPTQGMIMWKPLLPVVNIRAVIGLLRIAFQAQPSSGSLIKPTSHHMQSGRQRHR